MSTTYGPKNASYYVLTHSDFGRPDTKIDGVTTIEFEADALTLRGQDDRVLFMAPMREVVYVKAVIECGEPSSEPGIICREPRGHKGEHRP